MILNTTTGGITGTPTVAGSVNFSIVGFFPPGLPNDFDYYTELESAYTNARFDANARADNDANSHPRASDSSRDAFARHPALSIRWPHWTFRLSVVAQTTLILRASAAFC